MSAQVVVLEISSSDDEDEVAAVTQYGRSLKRPLEAIARYGAGGNDDDDVTVIDKLPCFVGRENFRSKRGKPVTQIDDLENDCCVLEGDPDRTVSVADAWVDSSDDLVVTAEKGPVACRDFPHARHLCVKFPFKSTPHEKHCELCHCYVCDKIAPCALWVSGDHCHSSDKEGKWKTLRNLHKQPKVPSISVPSSFNTIPSLTTMRSAVPANRNSQLSTGSISCFPLHNGTNAEQPVMCARVDQRNRFSSTNSLFPTQTEVISCPGYMNHMPGQNARFHQSGGRFAIPVQRNALNLGFHGRGSMSRRSLGVQAGCPEIMQRQGDSLNMLLSSNMRQNTLGSCSTSQRQVANSNSSDQMHVSDVLARNSSAPDAQLNIIWDFLLGSDSEDNNSPQNNSFRDISSNCATEPSGNSELTNLTMSQPNVSGQLSSSCASSSCELQLLPVASISEGPYNAIGNAGQWSAVQQMSVTPALFGSATTDQCAYTSDYQSFSLDWHGDQYSPFQADGGTLFQDQIWNYDPVQHTQSATRNIESIGLHVNTEQNLESHAIEATALTAQTQQPEWPMPSAALPDAQKTIGQLSLKQGFRTSQSSVGTSPCADQISAWETLALAQNHSYNFEFI